MRRDGCRPRQLDPSPVGRRKNTKIDAFARLVGLAASHVRPAAGHAGRATSHTASATYASLVDTSQAHTGRARNASLRAFLLVMPVLVTLAPPPATRAPPTIAAIEVLLGSVPAARLRLRLVACPLPLTAWLWMGTRLRTWLPTRVVAKRAQEGKPLAIEGQLDAVTSIRPEDLVTRGPRDGPETTRVGAMPAGRA